MWSLRTACKSTIISIKFSIKNISFLLITRTYKGVVLLVFHQTTNVSISAHSGSCLPFSAPSKHREGHFHCCRGPTLSAVMKSRDLKSTYNCKKRLFCFWTQTSTVLLFFLEIVFEIISSLNHYDSPCAKQLNLAWQTIIFLRAMLSMPAISLV